MSYLSLLQPRQRFERVPNFTDVIGSLRFKSVRKELLLTNKESGLSCLEEFIEVFGIKGLSYKRSYWKNNEEWKVFAHERFFQDKYGRVILTSQPSLRNKTHLDERTKRRAEIWGEKHGFDLFVSNELSWYYPGHTTLLIFTQRISGVKSVEDACQCFWSTSGVEG